MYYKRGYYISDTMHYICKWEENSPTFLDHNYKIAKLIQLNYAACQSLIEKSKTKTRFICKANDRCVLRDTETDTILFAFPTMFAELHDKQDESARFDFFYITQHSYTSIYFRILDLFDKINKMEK